jgi:hypothetical protein
MLYSKGGIPNRRSSSRRLASKVELVVSAMANFSLIKIRVLMTATMLWLHRSFRAEHFEWSHIENGVRMQKLWPVEVCCRKP